jgi:hypothetical protein
MLQVGGEQAAAILAEPGDESVRVHVRRQELGAVIAPGWDEVHASGTPANTTPPFVFGSELFPIISVTVATTISLVEADFVTLKLV